MSGTLENGDAWFHRWISVETGQSLLQDACQNVALDIPESSLTAPNGHAIPFASPSELRRHTFTRSKTLGASRKAVRRLFEGRGPEGQAASDFQGFLLFDTEDPTTGVSPDLLKPGEREEWVDIFHNQLPKLLKSKPYCDHFGTIFAKLNGTDPQRKGDKKRGQYKFDNGSMITIRGKNKWNVRKVVGSMLSGQMGGVDIVNIDEEYMPRVLLPL